MREVGNEWWKFATAINCIDGRVQIPVIHYLKEKYGVDYVDMITEPGANKVLAENKDPYVIESIKRRVQISVDKHNSGLIGVAGHYDCAGNPLEEDALFEQIGIAIKTMKTIESWSFGTQVIGLWVGENWEVSEVGKSSNSFLLWLSVDEEINWHCLTSGTTQMIHLKIGEDVGSKGLILKARE